MGHSSSEVRDAGISLLAESQVSLWDKNMAHRKHAQTSQFFWSVEDHWRESAWHFRIQSHLNSSLDLVLTLNQQIKELVCVDGGLSVISHQTYQGGVPLIGDFSKGSAPTGH
jgi:hypothetical protein